MIIYQILPNKPPDANLECLEGGQGPDRHQGWKCTSERSHDRMCLWAAASNWLHGGLWPLVELGPVVEFCQRHLWGHDLLGFGCNLFDVKLKLLWHLRLFTATRKKTPQGKLWWMRMLRDSKISRLLSAWDARPNIVSMLYVCYICMLIFHSCISWNVLVFQIHSISQYFRQFDICQPWTSWAAIIWGIQVSPLGQTFFILSLHIRVLLLRIHMICHFICNLWWITHWRDMERSGLKTCSSFARIGGSVLASESITPLRLHRDRRSSKFRVNFLKDAEGLENTE